MGAGQGQIPVGLSDDGVVSAGQRGPQRVPQY
jgi:hypothetical protein